MPINAYFTVCLAFAGDNDVDVFMFLFIIAFQVGGFLSQMLPITCMAREAQKAHKPLASIQGNLRNRQLLSNKVKLMAHYEMIHSKWHKISYNIGDTTYVTNQSIGQVRSPSTSPGSYMLTDLSIFYL